VVGAVADGQFLVRSGATLIGAAGGGDYVTNTVMTSDATLTTIATIPIVADHGVLIEVKVAGFRTNGVDQGFYVRRAGYVNRGGTVTRMGNIQTDFTRESTPSYNVTFTISGTDVLIQVLGETGHDVEWTSRHFLVDAS
jgi:hypothetical protein